MSSRHSDLVVATGRKSTKKASKKGGKRKLRHMVLRPLSGGGFMSEKHYEPEEGKEFDNPPIEKAHDTSDDMIDHAADTFDEEADNQGDGTSDNDADDKSGAE